MKKCFNSLQILKSGEYCRKFSKSVSYETLVIGATTIGSEYGEVLEIEGVITRRTLVRRGYLPEKCTHANKESLFASVTWLMRLPRRIQRMLLVRTIPVLAIFFTIATTTKSLADDEINCLTGQQSCGTNCCWSVENKKLTITGGKDGTIGTMDNYSWGKTGQNTQWPADITSIYVSGVENIGSEAFRNLRKVTNITISDSVERVSHNAFDNDSMLQYVDFGDAVTSIGSAVLQDSPRLIQIIVPDTLTDIARQSLGDGDLVGRNIQIICRGDKISCSNIYEKLSEYSSIKGQTYDATSQLFYANYEQCASTSYFWDGAKCVREPDVSKRKCCDSCKDMGGWCNRIRYTPAEAAPLLHNDNTNEVTITFKK